MDITTLGRAGYRLKGKNASVSVENGRVVVDRDKPFEISAPGEYEVGGVSVVGVDDPNGKIYVVELDGLRTAFLMDVTTKLSEGQVEEIGPVDIAVIPVLNPELATQVDPWVIICEKGSESPPIAKYSVTSDKLPTETQTVILDRRG